MNFAKQSDDTDEDVQRREEAKGAAGIEGLKRAVSSTRVTHHDSCDKKAARHRKRR